MEKETLNREHKPQEQVPEEGDISSGLTRFHCRKDVSLDEKPDPHSKDSVFNTYSHWII